jgi:Protein of unknown function (DUF2946)
MDDIVKQALAKWPNVPACYGWLGLDARGQWWMRDDRTQALGAFTSGVPGAKGSQLQHDKLIAFIHRNYDSVAEGPEVGQWFFQNGPQRVYIELEATPFVWRLEPHFAVAAHTGAQARAQRCVLDEHGRVYLDTDIGFGLVHTQDVQWAADAIEQGLWVPDEVPTRELPTRFGYVRSPQAAHRLLQDATK